MLLYKFDDYDYDQVCDEFEYLRRFENESLLDFTIRFQLICLRFKAEDKPSKIELIV